MDHFAVCNIELNHMTMGLFRVLKNTTRIYRATCEFIKDVVGCFYQIAQSTTLDSLNQAWVCSRLLYQKYKKKRGIL